MPFDAVRDLRWAWRNLRARGARGVLSVLLVACALGANALVFAASDSLLFRPLPYEAPERLVEIQRVLQGRSDPFLTSRLLDAWRAQEDLFTGVHGYLRKTVFLTGDGVPELVPTADVTPGLIGLLGTAPRWGRGLLDTDALQPTPQVVVISESLARRRFGDPAAAVGGTIQTTGEPLWVAGVMQRTFRFPDNEIEIWRAFDPRGPLAQGFVGSMSLARLRKDVALDTAAAAVAQRAPDIVAAAGARPGVRFTAAPWGMRSRFSRTTLIVLLGAAACLLLLVCANVASLELAGALQRARRLAIQLSLGASRAHLCRIALMEALGVVAAAAAVAGVLLYAGAEAIASFVPERLISASVNPIDLDRRALAFMTAVAASTWLLVSIPLVVFVARGRLAGLLKLEAHSASASMASGRMRRILTSAQVAVAVVLVTGGTLYLRTYLELLDLEKGFDSSGVVSIQLTVPPQALPSAADRLALLDRVRAHPAVVAATQGLPPSGNGSRFASEGIDTGNGPAPGDELTIKLATVDQEYFRTLRIPLRDGRWFEPGEPATSSIVSETLARRYWPDGNAVGKRFRWGSKQPWLQVVGVAGHVRDRSDGVTTPAPGLYAVYLAEQPPAPPRTGGDARAATGGFFGYISLLVRVDSPRHVADVVEAVRTAEPRFALEAELVDDLYARYHEDRLLTARIVGAFGVFSFIVAMAGVYAVMAFLVAARTREIGIRVALGAQRGAVQRLVVLSAARMTALGAVAGMAVAMGTSRFIRTHLFGVTATEPVLMTAILTTTIIVAILAAWHPARRAARIDPVVALRSE